MIQAACEGQGTLLFGIEADAPVTYTSSLCTSGGAGLRTPAARDLIRVGEAVFLTDRAFRRGRRLGQQTRRLNVELPVEEPRRWAGLARAVAQFAGFVSHDIWSFEFSRLERQRREYAKSDRTLLRLPLKNGVVSLFSNGLDSLCGLAAALERGQSPILVSHAPPGAAHVRKVLQVLEPFFGRRAREMRSLVFNFKVHDVDKEGRRSLFPERSRRTRPFLFLSMAGAVALDEAVETVYLNENGPLALNFPFRPHMSGVAISRHAHPEALRRFEFILKELWPYDGEPRVENPFLGCTKAEELAALGEAKALSRQTKSCEYAGQQVAFLKSWLKRHGKGGVSVQECGLCLPCLVRRVALERAGVREDPRRYAFNDLRAFRSPGRYASYPLFNSVRSYVLDLHDFCSQISRISPSQFVVQFAYELALLPPAERTSERTRRIYDLYKRFAREVLRHLGT